MRSSFSFFSKSIIVAAALLCAGAALAAWTPAPGNPPACPTGTPGCDTPINTSSADQTKTGKLTVTQPVISGTSLGAPKLVLSANDTAHTPQLNIQQSGTGDVGVQFTLVGTGKDWYMGVDNSAADQFKIGIGTSIGTTQTLVLSSTGNLGIGGPAAATYTLDVKSTATNGGGDVRAHSFVYSSDERLKGNIQTLGGALSKVLAIRGVTFVWKAGTPSAGQADIGVIAQEVEKVAPEAVTTDADGYKAVDYPRLIPLLINAIHEQQQEIDALKARLDSIAPQH